MRQHHYKTAVVLFNIISLSLSLSLSLHMYVCVYIYIYICKHMLFIYVCMHPNIKIVNFLTISQEINFARILTISHDFK